MKVYKLCFLISMAATLILSVFCQQSGLKNDSELELLTSWMTGSFSSQAQAEADTNFYDIRLEMVRIWNDRDDAVWLYVEQAAAWALEKPYRQRVYRVVQNEDGSFESAVYTLENPLRFAGAWRDAAQFSQLTPDSLTERTGCAITLTRSGETFSGSTLEKNCSSELRGASYATSEVQIQEHLLTSWDKGFDSNDTQVWGAVTGPYRFEKLSK